MYFKNFPLIKYVTNINGKPVVKLVKDITINARIRKRILENYKMFDEYLMEDNETPEIVAAKYYGFSVYHWVVMLYNQKYNNLNDFPMDQKTFLKYLENKYSAVKVPTFPSNEIRDLYIAAYNVEDLYNGNSSDAIEWKPNTYYNEGQLLNHYNSYVVTLNSGTSDEYLDRFKTTDAIEWDYLINVNVDDLIVFEGRYYKVKESGLTGTEGPTHVVGEEVNGDAVLRADVLFVESVNVVDLDTSLHWSLFPTDIEAIDFIDLLYNSYGEEIHASSKIYDIHHYETVDGGFVVNYYSPYTYGQPLPINAITGQPFTLDEVKVVTNYMYEDRLNEEKRRIKLINKSVLESIMNQLRAVVSR